jgi:hypothetical protein
MINKKTMLREKIKNKKIRLEAYQKRELLMLSPEGVQSYGIGSRNVARYNTDLATVRNAIKELEAEIEELENSLNGIRPRKAFGIIPRDL